MASSKKAVIITGCSTGFGYLMAETLKGAGHDVVATMRGVDGRNAEAAASLRAQGVHVVEIDVTVDESVSSGVSTALELLGGRCDVAVANAGVGMGAGFTEAVSIDQLQAQLDVNIVGVHRFLRAVLPAMRSQRSGLVVTISSIGGRLVVPWMGIYAGTKHFIQAYTAGLAYDLKQLGIDVCAIQPGGFDSKFGSNVTKNLAADVEVAAGYADVKPQPMEWFGAMFGAELTEEQKAARNPQRVADLLLTLVNMEPGTVPINISIDPEGTRFLDAVNSAVDAFAESRLTAYGVSHFLPPRSQAASLE